MHAICCKTSIDRLNLHFLYENIVHRGVEPKTNPALYNARWLRILSQINQLVNMAKSVAKSKAWVGVMSCEQATDYCTSEHPLSSREEKLIPWEKAQHLVAILLHRLLNTLLHAGEARQRWPRRLRHLESSKKPEDAVGWFCKSTNNRIKCLIMYNILLYHNQKPQHFWRTTVR